MHDITMNMNIGKARAIFDQIDSDKYTEDEKAVAIYIVMAMETKNSVTKASATCWKRRPPTPLRIL